MTDSTATLLSHTALSPREVRQLLRCGKSSIYNAIASGQVPHFLIGGAIKVPTSWVKKQLGLSEAA